jgi:hypothetical protein
MAGADKLTDVLVATASDLIADVKKSASFRLMKSELRMSTICALRF